ncbi:MAG: formylglycine-generating enzyme family protein [Hyphomicrobium sp.]
MVAVPGAADGVTLGSPDGEAGRISNERQRVVRLRPFAIGQHEVTVAQYALCVAAQACRPPEWLEPGGEHHVEAGGSAYYRRLGDAITGEAQPVVGVSHDDATSYASWLSRRTSRRYRLPSESEWEYAARAGTTSPFWWGQEPTSAGRVMANCLGCGSAWDGRAPASVTSFDPNPWGLYNVHGNVWEWVADFYCDDTTTAPADGGPRDRDDCASRDAPGLRTLRGGSNAYEPDKMRAASRLRNFASFRNITVGFRVARDLDDGVK